MTHETLCIILLIIACIVSLLVLWYKIQKDGLRETVIKLIVVAERNFESGEGKEKMKSVIAGVHDLIPFPLSSLLTEKSISDFCQIVFDEVKEALNYKPQ